MGVVFALSPDRISLPRYDGQVGPHDVLFEVCSAFTCVAACTLALPPIRGTLSEGFSHFVTSMTAPVASGGSEFAGWDLRPLENAVLSRRTPKAGISCQNGLVRNQARSGIEARIEGLEANARSLTAVAQGLLGETATSEEQAEGRRISPFDGSPLARETLSQALERYRDK